MRKKTQGIIGMVIGGVGVLVNLFYKGDFPNGSVNGFPPAVATGLPIVVFVFGVIYFWIGSNEE